MNRIVFEKLSDEFLKMLNCSLKSGSKLGRPEFPSDCCPEQFCAAFLGHLEAKPIVKKGSELPKVSVLSFVLPSSVTFRSKTNCKREKVWFNNGKKNYPMFQS